MVTKLVLPLKAGASTPELPAKEPQQTKRLPAYLLAGVYCSSKLEAVRQQEGYFPRLLVY